MARSFGYRHDRKRLRARAVCGEGVYRQERDSDHRNLRDARLFQLFKVRDFSEKFGKDNDFFEIVGLTVKLIISPAISKKILALVLAFACAFTMFAGAAFTDQADIKVENEVVDTLIELGVINGYTDGSFKPNDTVTRAEMAKMIYVLRTGNPLTLLRTTMTRPAFY